MEIEIDWKGKMEKVVIEPLSWGENNDCIRKSVNIVNGMREIDIVTQNEYKLLKSIKKAPFKLNLEELRKIPVNIGEMLFNKMMEINNITGDNLKNLNPPSTQEE